MAESYEKIYKAFVLHLEEKYPNFDVGILLPQLRNRGIITQSEYDLIAGIASHKDRNWVSTVQKLHVAKLKFNH